MTRSTSPADPVHTAIPHLVDAVRGGAVQRSTIREALEANGLELGESTLSGLLRLAVAQGFLTRTGAKKGTRYAVAKWQTRAKRTTRTREAKPAVEELDDGDAPTIVEFIPAPRVTTIDEMSASEVDALVKMSTFEDL